MLHRSEATVFAQVAPMSFHHRPLCVKKPFVFNAAQVARPVRSTCADLCKSAAHVAAPFRGRPCVQLCGKRGCRSDAILAPAAGGSSPCGWGLSGFQCLGLCAARGRTGPKARSCAGGWSGSCPVFDYFTDSLAHPFSFGLPPFHGNALRLSAGMNATYVWVLDCGDELLFNIWQQVSIRRSFV